MLTSSSPGCMAVLRYERKNDESATDLLDDSGKLHRFRAPRFSGSRADVHGTGCAFSAALLAALCDAPLFLRESDRELAYANVEDQTSLSNTLETL